MNRKAGISPAAGWFAVLLVWLCLQLVLGVVASFAGAAAASILLLGAIEVVVLGGAVALLGIAGKPPDETGQQGFRRAFDAKFLRLSAPRLSWLAIALGLGVVANPLAEFVRLWVETVSPTPEAQAAAKIALLRHDTASRTVALFVVVGLLGPWVEELFYRGALFTGIAAHSGARWAAMVSGAGFVFAHGDVRDWPSLALVGALLTWQRFSHDNLWPSFVTHACFNACTLVALVTGYEPGHRGIVLAVALAALAFLLVAHWRITRSGG